RGFFAERLAPFDAAAAVELVKPLPPDERTRHFGNMAHNLAGVNPAEAGRILKELSDYSRASYAIRVCYRMASVDRERAQRIAEQIKANSRAGDVLPESRECRAQAYGAMAMALVAKDGPAARRLLGQARDELRQVRNRDA